MAGGLRYRITSTALSSVRYRFRRKRARFEPATNTKSRADIRAKETLPPEAPNYSARFFFCGNDSIPVPRSAPLCDGSGQTSSDFDQRQAGRVAFIERKSIM